MTEKIEDYAALLEHSFQVERACQGRDISRLEYLSGSIFEFTTYESEMDELFAAKAVEVCRAITERRTFEYIDSRGNRVWYLMMCNMPFFADRIEWGSSVRGAWWNSYRGVTLELNSCGLWVGEEQITEGIEFTADEWERFIRAVIEFANPPLPVIDPSMLEGK